MSATTAQQIAASRDNDILSRLIATAEQEGIANAQQWVEQRRGLLVAADLGDTSLAEVFAFAQAQKGLPAGADPAYVTDALLTSAVTAVNTTPL